MLHIHEHYISHKSKIPSKYNYSPHPHPHPLVNFSLLFLYSKMVQKISISPLIFFIITCGAILVRSELIQIPKRPYLRGNPGIIPRGIPYHKSKELTENDSEDDVDPTIGDGISNPYFRNLKKHAIVLQGRPYLIRGHNPGQLQQSAMFHKASSPQLSQHLAVIPAVSKISNTNLENLKKNSIVVPKRPYLRGNPGILPQGIPFHKSKGFKENQSKDDVDPIIGGDTSNPYFENLKKHAIVLHGRPYLIRGRNPGQVQQSVTFHKAISPRLSENHVVSPPVSKNSNTNSLVPKRPYLRGNPGLLPQGVAFHKAISPRISKNHVVSPVVTKISNTNSIVLKRSYLKGNPRLLPQGVTFHKVISPRPSKNDHNEHVVSPAISKTSNTNSKEQYVSR